MSDFIDLPATSDSQKTVPIGIHRLTIVKMEKAVDKSNQAIVDNRNYPGIRIYFQSASGDTIDSIFHYSPKPENDPTRSDPALMCKSEFRLNNLKKALGFGTGPVKADLIKGKHFWGMVVGEMWVHEANSQPVLRDENDKDSKIIFSKVGSIFWPYNPTKDGSGKVIDENRPVKDGDPNNPSSNGVPSGEFLRPVKKKWEDVQKYLEKGSEKKGAQTREYKDDFGDSKPAAQPAPQPQAEGPAAAQDLPEQPVQTSDDW